MADLSIARRQLAGDGYAVIPGFISQQACNRIRGEALMDLSRQSPYPHPRIEQHNGYPALLYWPALSSPFLLGIRDLLAPVAQDILGQNVKQLNNQIYFRCPGDEDQFAWHQDISFREPRERYPGIEDAYLQTTIAIDRIDERNSPVEFISGSHRSGDLGLSDPASLRSFVRGERRGTRMLAEPGDLMLWSVMAVHGSEPNRSDRMRMTYMNGFARADAAMDWPTFLYNGEIVPIDHLQIK